MPNMRVCRNTGAILFSPTKEELEIQAMKKDLKESLKETEKLKAELADKLKELDKILKKKI